MPTEHIKETDTLAKGTPKLNKAIDQANKAEVDSAVAKDTAIQALAKSENTQIQLDTIVIDGDSSVEAAQARVEPDGTINPTLKARLDKKELEFSAQLAQRATKEELNNLGRLELAGTYATKTELETAHPTGANGIFLVTADGYVYRWDGTTWVQTVQFQSTGIADKTIDYSKLSFSPVVGVASTNLFNKYTALKDKFIQYTTGDIKNGVGYYASDYIPVIGGQRYKLVPTSQQGAYFDINKNYISGFSHGYNLDLIPEGAAYVRLSLLASELDILMFVKGRPDTSVYVPHLQINPNTIKDVNNYLTVKSDGTGDFTSLRQAIESINNHNKYNVYNIMIYEGTYDILSYYTENEKANTNFIGLTVPDYVNLIGVGNRDNIHIKGELPDTADKALIQRASTLNLMYNSNLENLTVTAKNLRYAVHDESSNAVKDWDRRVKNCYFEHYGNVGGAWTSVQAWGEGCSSGSYSEFEDCVFVNNSAAVSPYSSHNNTGFTKPSKHIFNNCDFINHADGYAVRFGSMGSGQKDIVVMNNCRLNGKILLFEELGNGVGIDFYLTGSGNTKVPWVINQSSPNVYQTHFTDETIECLNVGTNIVGSKPVKFDGFGRVRVMDPTDDVSLFIGITFGPLSSEKVGTVKMSGYFKTSWLGLGAVSVGEKIGIVNGALAKVTSGDYIAICDVPEHVRLVS